MKPRSWILILLLALIVGGVISIFASTHRDTLETMLHRGHVQPIEHPAHHGVLPDYAVPGVKHTWLAKGLAGALGTIATFAVLMLLAKLLTHRRSRGDP